jgi:hypothetical protein
MDLPNRLPRREVPRRRKNLATQLILERTDWSLLVREARGIHRPEGRARGESADGMWTMSNRLMKTARRERNPTRSEASGRGGIGRRITDTTVVGHVEGDVAAVQVPAGVGRLTGGRDPGPRG